MTISKLATCRSVTIFEGPDGGGKSFAAQWYAQVTNARYVHLGPFPAIQTAQLGRLYVEALLPALLGYQDVVLDRCWLSEEPYGLAFRNGALRLARAHERMLARLAWRCGAVLVLCLPTFETCVGNWGRRRREELLKSEAQLRAVHDWYGAAAETERLDLNTVLYDYTRVAVDRLPLDIAAVRPKPHPLSVRSAGRWDARVAIVGEAFGMVKEADALYQWPFASFGNQGCSRWFTEQLHATGVEEAQLLWVNADQLANPGNGLAEHLRQRRVVAFGEVAGQVLAQKAVPHVQVQHPQSWKRFHYGERFQLLDALKAQLIDPQETASHA